MPYRLTPLLFFLFSSLAAGSQKTFTLAECIDYAYERHTEIRLGRLNLKDAEWQIKENRSIAYPQLSLGLSMQHFLIQPGLPVEALGLDFGEPGQRITFALRNNFGGSVMLNQLLFNNSYIASIRAAKMYKDYVNLQLEATKEKIRNQVTDSYLPALLVTESLEVLDGNITNQEKLLSETKEILRAGFAEQLDVDRLEYVLSLLRTERDALSRQYSMAVDALKFQMGMPLSEDIRPADDLDRLIAVYSAINPDEPLQYAKRPDYVVLLKARELSEVQVTALRKNWFPTLSLFASYDPSFQGNDKLFWIPSAIAGVRLSMPLFDGGLNKARTERAILQSMQLEEQKNMLTQAYDLEINTARNRFNSAKEKLSSQEANLNLARRIYESTQKKYSAGVGSSFEVTQAQAEMYQAQGTWITSRFDYLQAIVGLRKALGN